MSRLEIQRQGRGTRNLRLPANIVLRPPPLLLTEFQHKEIQTGGGDRQEHFFFHKLSIEAIHGTFTSPSKIHILK